MLSWKTLNFFSSLYNTLLMICVVLPAAHSALDLCCLHSHRNYSILHWLFCCTLYWIFSLVPLSLLTLNICSDLMADSCSCLYCCLVISQRYGSWNLSCQHVRVFSTSFFKPFLLLTFCKCYTLKALFVIPAFQLLSSAEFWRYCPVCVNFMQGKHRDWAIYVRKLVWNQHICEHDSPWSLSVINYLCSEESQETIFKDQLLCIFFFLSLKEMCVLSIYVDACDDCQRREATWFGKEEGEIKSKKRRKASESCRDVRLMWYHADRACWVCVLPFPNSSSASCHSVAAVGPP